MADTSKQRIERHRAKMSARGLVPLRITEIWCTPSEKEELKQKIASAVADTIKNTPR
jgi:hypothetical protein